MNCFDNLIGLKGIADGNSVVMYLEQCGITTDMIQKANYTHDDTKTLLTDKINEATNIVASQIKSANATRLRTFDSLANDRVGHPARILTSVAAKTGYLAGGKIELEKDSDYVRINIDSISLFVNTTGNVDVKIYDLTEGRLLNTVTVAAISGEMVYKDVNLSFRAQRRNLALAIVYDSSFTSNNTTALGNSCGSCGGRVKRQSRYANVAGIKIPNSGATTIDTVSYESDTAGVSFTYTIQCDFEQWICKNRELFMLLCLYYTAYHLAQYAMISTKFNSLTLDYRQSVESIRDMNLTNYNNEFSAVMNGMKLPENSDCFICKKQAQHTITL